jgi:uncharacterized delta-60 repeat protein
MIANPLLRALSRAVTLALFAMIVLPLLAAPGDLDPSWGGDGVVEMDAGFPVFVTHTADDKVAVASISYGRDGSTSQSFLGFGASRYHSDGQIDMTFGQGGNSIVPPFEGFDGLPIKGAIQSDGAIVMVAIMQESEAIPRVRHLTFVRLKTDGTQDMAFGEDGFAIHTPPLADDNNRVSFFMSDLVVDAQDRLVLSVWLEGNVQDNIARYLLRLNADGSLDTTFGNSGFVEYTGNFYISNVQVQSDGKLIVTGATDLDSDPEITCFEATVKRLHANGEPDLSFGVGGEVRFSPRALEFEEQPPNYDWIRTTHLLPDGKMLMIGYAGFCAFQRDMPPGEPPDPPTAGGRSRNMLNGTAQDEPEIPYEFFARLNADGTLDTTFDGNGIRFLPARASDETVHFLNSAIQVDGKVVVASVVNYFDDFQGQLEVTRFMPDGTPDLSWPMRTFVFTSGGPGNDFPNPYVDPTGRIMLTNSIRIRRFQGDPAFGYTALTPVHLATGYPTTGGLSLTFAAPVTAGAGAVEIRRTADSSLFARVDVTDTAQVSGGGSSVIQIDPLFDFEPNTAYFALVDPGAFVNAAGHPFSGVRALTEWHFVTGDAPVVVPPTQLLLNRGFEGKGAKPSRPAKWTGNRLLASEGRICNVERRDKPPLIYAQAGRCAFRFKHTASRGRSIAQNITPSGVLAGQVVRLSAQVRRNGLTTGAALRAQITYTDGTTEALVIPIPTGSGGYVPVEATLTLAKDVASVKVRAVTGTSKGTWLLDAVSLTVESPTGDAGAGNPAGGDGLRGLDLPAAAW